MANPADPNKKDLLSDPFFDEDTKPAAVQNGTNAVSAASVSAGSADTATSAVDATKQGTADAAQTSPVQVERPGLADEKAMEQSIAEGKRANAYQNAMELEKEKRAEEREIAREKRGAEYEIARENRVQDRELAREARQQKEHDRQVRLQDDLARARQKDAEDRSAVEHDRNKAKDTEEYNRRHELESLESLINSYNNRTTSAGWTSSLTGSIPRTRKVDLRVGGKKATIEEVYARQQELLKSNPYEKTDSVGLFTPRTGRFDGNWSMQDGKLVRTDDAPGKRKTPTGTKTGEYGYVATDGTGQFNVNFKHDAATGTATVSGSGADNPDYVKKFAGNLGYGSGYVYNKKTHQIYRKEQK